MIKNIVKIRKEGDKHILFNQRGMVLELNENEYGLFKKYSQKRKFPVKYHDFFNKLCWYEMTTFDNYTPEKVPIDYSQKLLHHNSKYPVFKAPIVAHLGITAACNMHCKYCSIRKPYNELKELDTNEWKIIIKKLSDFGVFQIGFTGGEPTLRDDLAELARYVTKMNCTFNLTTNCWKLDEGLVKELKEAGMRQCQVSLDCHIPEINDSLRTSGSFSRVIKAIKLLQKHGIITGVDCVLTKHNLKYIPQFVRWLGRKNVLFLTIIKIKQGDLTREKFLDLLPGYDEYSSIIEVLCNRINENPCVTLDCGSVSNLECVLKEDEMAKVPIAGCPAGHTLLSISPNGDIYPCVALGSEKFGAGNALKDDIKKIWRENKSLQELREIKSRIKGSCRTCKRLYHCRGGCRGIANSLCKKEWESDPTCLFSGEKNG
jgi:radical SAM protein with 4Fe4S-binding SPASM domain